MSLRFRTTTSKGKVFFFYSFIKIKFCHRVLTVEISVECLRELQVAKPDIFASSLYLYYSGLPGTLSRLVCVHVAAAAALVLQACSFLFFTLVPSLLAVSQLASA